VLETFGLHSLFLFATTVFVVNATPGADLLLTFTNTMRAGVRGGLVTALGIGSGSLVHTLFVVLGVSALLAASPQAFQALQWVGAAYLVWVAAGLIRDGFREPLQRDASQAEIAAIVDGPRPAQNPSLNPSPSMLTLFNQGLMSNVLNPKVALFFLALLPQFVQAGAPRMGAGFALLGLWFAVQGFLFLALFVRLVSMVRRWQPTPARRRALHAVAAAALVLVALRLVVVGSA
jgi:threonine/homoserine/homoserine lactone efflux protein